MGNTGILEMQAERRGLMAERKRLVVRVGQIDTEVKRIDRELPKLQKKFKKETPALKYEKTSSWRKRIEFVLGGKELNISEIIAEIEKREPVQYGTVQRNLQRMIEAGEILKLTEYNSKYKLNAKGA